MGGRVLRRGYSGAARVARKERREGPGEAVLLLAHTRRRHARMPVMPQRRQRGPNLARTHPELRMQPRRASVAMPPPPLGCRSPCSSRVTLSRHRHDHRIRPMRRSGCKPPDPVDLPHRRHRGKPRGIPLTRSGGGTAGKMGGEGGDTAWLVVTRVGRTGSDTGARALHVLQLGRIF